MLRNILAGSRYFVIIAVLGTFVASITMLVYGGITVVSILILIIVKHVSTTEEIKNVAAMSVEVIDLFLLGIVFYIISLGLYRLFIDEKLPLPHWLEITNFDDLKEKLLGVVIVLLAVTFLGSVVDWHFGDFSILALGIAVGLVLFALGYLLSKGAITRKVAQIDRTNDKTKVE